MKVLHIVPTYVPAYRYGGPIYSVHGLNRSLVEAGIDVTVYTTNIDGLEVLKVPTDKIVVVDGVKVHYFPASFPRQWFYSREMHCALSKTVGAFDIVHITSVFLAASTLGSYYAKKFRKPYIISPRGSLMAEPLKKKSSLKKQLYLFLIEKKNLAGAVAIHFTVVAEQNEYIRAGFPHVRDSVVPNGVEEESMGSTVELFHEKLGISNEKKIVIYMGRLGWKKGFDTLIPAFAKVAQEIPEAMLVISEWSDEGYKYEIEKLISRHNVEDRVLFIGPLKGAERVAAFKECDVFILPSYSENFGVAVAQAMLAGLPVVITDGVGIAPLVAQARAGVVVKKDVEAVSDALRFIFKNSSEGKAMGLRGKELAEREFSWKKIADEFVKVYSECIAHYGR